MRVKKISASLWEPEKLHFKEIWIQRREYYSIFQKNLRYPFIVRRVGVYVTQHGLRNMFY